MYLLKPFLAGAFAGAGAFKLIFTLVFGFSDHLPPFLETASAHDLLTVALLIATAGAGLALAWNVRGHRLTRTKKT